MNRATRHPDDLPPTICGARTAADSLTELRKWLHELEEFGVPRFGELGFRLQCYRDRLSAEFGDEEASIRLKGDSVGHARLRKEFRELSQQHGQFLDELDNMVVKLHQDQPPFESWQEAIRQFNEFQTEIDRHKSREQQLRDAVETLSSP